VSDLAPLRIGVTGSREFADRDLIRDALIAAHDRARPHRGHVLVHGQCDPRHPDTGRVIPWATARRMSWEVQGRYLGADWLADWCAITMLHELSWEIERHPADWEASCRPECRPGHRRRKGRGPEYCPAAGNYRNAAMVALGARCCIALILDCSAGAAGCADLADRAGIEVRRFTVASETIAP